MTIYHIPPYDPRVVLKGGLYAGKSKESRQEVSGEHAWRGEGEGYDEGEGGGSEASFAGFRSWVQAQEEEVKRDGDKTEVQ